MWPDENNYYKEKLLKKLPIKWESLHKDPLHALLNHSDCDGYITLSNLRGIVKRLKVLLPSIPDNDGWIEKTNTFIDGCELAISERKRLTFS